MKTKKARILSFTALWLIGMLAAPGQTHAAASAERVYYAIEVNGVLCGYMEVWEAEVQREGRAYLQQQSRIFALLSVLGSRVDQEIETTSLVDPLTQKTIRIDACINQGTVRHTFGLEVSGGLATVRSSLRSEAVTIPVTPGLLLGNDEVFAAIKREFIDNRATEASFDLLELMEQEVQRSIFKKVGEERMVLAGRTFQAAVIDQVNAKTGTRVRYWLAPDHEHFLQFEVRNRKVYLSDRQIVDRIKVSNMDGNFFTGTNVAIANAAAISRMKLRVLLEPTGFILDAGGLSVPGQSFAGTVRENRIEGILEIAHARYQGKDAPPFPPSFASDVRLQRYLGSDPFTEAGDPVLVHKAKEITAGASDCWQAATRLSRWVAENIGYAIPGGITARKTYEIRAGECGAHSFLLAAFCRAVGIPARVVFGALYVPNFGGGFGQHAWNELYMGPAGWIPVDATAMEPDFIDSGHIRLGEVQSVSQNAFGGRKIEVLDYRLGNSSGERASATDSGLAPFLGSFADPRAGRSAKVMEREGNLTLDIPGRVALPFHPPDERGRWKCILANNIYLMFARDEKGIVAEMSLHQILTLPRKSKLEKADAGTPAELLPYLGVYFLAAANADFTVLVQEGRLAVHDPMRKTTVRLQPPGADEGRTDEFNKNTVYFEREGGEEVALMKIDVAEQYRRGELAADIVERAVRAEGLEAGLKTYAALKENPSSEVFFDERSFQRLGDRWLAEGKAGEAVAIFKLNTEVYPESFNAWERLAEAYMKDNQREMAIASCRRALQLNPGSENARKMLEKFESR